jgi:hypothetical protein
MRTSRARYFRLYDDMSTDKRWYLDGPWGADKSWLGTSLSSGKRFDGASPLFCDVHHSGPPLELTMTLEDVPVVNERVAEIFDIHCKDDAQLIPARASEGDAKLWAVNVLAAPDCIDDARCDQASRYTAEDGEPDRIGEYRLIIGLRIDPARAGGHAILRPRGWWVCVIVAEPLAKALRKAKVRCELTPVS